MLFSEEKKKACKSEKDKAPSFGANMKKPYKIMEGVGEDGGVNFHFNGQISKEAKNEKEEEIKEWKKKLTEKKVKRRLLNTNSITQQIKGFDRQREREKKK